jgi:hypothetical protein
MNGTRCHAEGRDGRYVFARGAMQCDTMNRERATHQQRGVTGVTPRLPPRATRQAL